MLEKPDVQEQHIVTCLQEAFGLPVTQLTFLPLGADANTAVYRAVTNSDTPYFVKLRSGVFDPTSVTLPKWLSDQGGAHIIPPLTAKNGQLWADLDSAKVLVFPFVDGRDAYEVALSHRQWREFGTAFKTIHTATLPPELAAHTRRETYSPKWREMVTSFVNNVDDHTYADPVAIKTASLLQDKRAEILDLVAQAGRLAAELAARPLEFVLCHSDIHAGNLHITTNGDLYIVDWDDPILAPKERDLMYVGGGLLGGWTTPQAEETRFYRGYGRTQVDVPALAYYRYERIVQDIGEYCQELLLTDEGGEDRAQSFGYLASNFLPGHTIELAYLTEASSAAE